MLRRARSGLDRDDFAKLTFGEPWLTLPALLVERFGALVGTALPRR